MGAFQITSTATPAAANSRTAFCAPACTRFQCSCVDPFGIMPIRNDVAGWLPRHATAPINAINVTNSRRRIAHNYVQTARWIAMPPLKGRPTVDAQ